MELRLRTKTSQNVFSGARRIVFAGPMLAGALFASPLAAQTPPPQTPEETERSLNEKRKALEASESKAKALQIDVADLDAERERLNARN